MICLYCDFGVLKGLGENMAAALPDKITLWTMEDEIAEPEYFGKVDVGGAATLEALRLALESNDVLEWPFEFWDLKDKRRIRKRLERLNGFMREVHVIQSGKEDPDASKRRRLADGSFTVSTAEVAVAAPVHEVPEFPEVEVEEEDPTVPAIGSRVSGSTESTEVDNNPLKSQLLSTEIMDRYLERAKKLRAELKRIAMDDHDWWLKSFDLNGNGVVKLWCAECQKDCRGSSKEHTKSQIDNLFNNFRRSHIVSTLHVRNYCAAKNINFEDHPQSTSRNGRPVTVIPEDHKTLITEGVQILDGVNASLPTGHKQFKVLGNLNAENNRCYWFKVKCPYCRELMVLCPPRKTLEANLRNHLSGFKHQKAVEAANQ